MQKMFLDLLLLIYNTIAFHNLGVTIIIIAVASRVVFFPLSRQQAKTAKKMAELAPHISSLKEKHKGNQQAFNQAQLALYKEHGVNPAAGCLPSILQIVVLFGLLGALNKIITGGISTRFLIWDMAKPDAYTITGIPFLVPGILVIAASLTQYIQMKMMMPSAPKIRPEDKQIEKKEKEDFQSSFAEAQSSMIWMFPLMFLLFGTKWPSGLALYWSLGSVIGIAQQYKVSGWGGLETTIKSLVKLKS